MAETSGWQQGSSGASALFVLASELDPGLEGVRRRQQEKHRMLLSAGVVFPTEEFWNQGGAGISLMAGPCDGDGPCQGYSCNAGTSPTGASTGQTSRSR